MKIPEFFGGSDVQRSPNISDNKLINLVPTTNDAGNVTAFYKVDGLKSEGALSGIPTGAYKTKTGRAFYVSGTTLYELSASNVSTSRGTVTAGEYSFSDNGIELICVNGVDGWLLTLATNALTQIKVLTGNVTITIASPAVLTKTTHGLAAGDRVMLSTTGALPSGLTDSTVYYVLSSGLTANDFQVSLTSGGAAVNTSYYGIKTVTINVNGSAGTVTISNGTPCIVTETAHGRKAGDRVWFTTSGTLPSPLTFDINYYVLASGLTTNTYQISTVRGGPAINTTTAGSGTHFPAPQVYGYIVPSSAPSVSPADPVAFTTDGTMPNITAGTEYYISGFPLTFEYNSTFSRYVLYLNLGAHLCAGDKVRIYSDNNLPSGVESGREYYLLQANSTSWANHFDIAASAGGARIDLGSMPSGTNNYIILGSDSFRISTTSGGVYTSQVSISGTNTGTHSYYKTANQQYGTHTYTTLGYGFPNGCTSVDYMNGRFVAFEPNTQNFFVSEPNDGGWWDALNIQTVDSNPDNVTGQAVSHNELIMFCENSGEVFYDSGSLPSPFVRNKSAIFEVGCAAEKSIAKLDNTIYWLGQSEEGKGIIYRLNGYTPTRISTYGIEDAIQSMATISDARAFSYQKDGHHFYVITFPTGNKTFVFDANTNLWHERAAFASGEFSEWPVKYHLYFNGKHLCMTGDTSLYSLDKNTYKNGTAAIKVLRSFRSPESDMVRVKHNSIEFEIESGTTPLSQNEAGLMLRWSNDGKTWSNILTQMIGAVGEYAKRIKFNKLGITRGRSRIYEVSNADDVKIVFKDAYLN